MKCYRLFVVIVGFALALGCDQKPEVKQIAKPLESQNELKGFPLLDPPAQSDPAAVEVVKKIINAHTNNQPEIIEKLKGVSITRNGIFTLPDPTVHGKTIKLESHATWPNRSRYVWHGIAPVPMAIRINEHRVFQDLNGQAMSPPLADNRFQDHFRDNYGNWLQLLVPLIEPKTVVAVGLDFQLLDQSLKGIRVWHPNAAQAIIYYDPKTFVLKRIAYDGRTDGLPCLYEHSLADHKPQQGFLIAEKVYIRSNGRETMEFNQVTLEAAKTHAAKLFSEP